MSALAAWEAELDRVYEMVGALCTAKGLDSSQTFRVLVTVSDDKFMMEQACALESKIDWTSINDS